MKVGRASGPYSVDERSPDGGKSVFAVAGRPPWCARDPLDPHLGEINVIRHGLGRISLPCPAISA